MAAVALAEPGAGLAAPAVAEVPAVTFRTCHVFPWLDGSVNDQSRG